jgi:hypothetical protein
MTFYYSRSSCIFYGSRERGEDENAGDPRKSGMPPRCTNLDCPQRMIAWSDAREVAVIKFFLPEE